MPAYQTTITGGSQRIDVAHGPLRLTLARSTGALLGLSDERTGLAITVQEAARCYQEQAPVDQPGDLTPDPLLAHPGTSGAAITARRPRVESGLAIHLCHLRGAGASRRPHLERGEPPAVHPMQKRKEARTAHHRCP
jgi:hypothetical protein